MRAGASGLISGSGRPSGPNLSVRDGELTSTVVFALQPLELSRERLFDESRHRVLLRPTIEHCDAFYALVLVGMGMCVLGGISRAPSTLGWTHPVTLSGAVLGVAILVLTMALTFGWIAALQPAASAIGITVERAAVLLVALLQAAKWAIGMAFVR